MSNIITVTNKSMEDLAEATGLPIDQLEYITGGEYQADAMAKIIRNLTKCIASFNASLGGQGKDVVSNPVGRPQ